MKVKWIVLTLLVGGSVFADPVTYSFSAQITTISTSLTDVTNTTYSVGQTWSGSITYDLATAVERASYGSVTEYTNCLQSFWMDNGTETIGGSIVADEGYLPIFQVINNSFGFDEVVFKFYHGQGELGTPVEGLHLDVLTLSLSTSNTNLFADTSVPLSINPSAFDKEGISLVYYEGPTNYMVSSVQAVPEPATAMMLFFGSGIGFVIHRLRRWANR